MPLIPQDIDKDIEAFKAEAEQAAREVVFFWLQAIMVGTPVDTGFHRNNWQLDFGEVRPRVDGTPPASEAQGETITKLPALNGESNARLSASASFLQSWTLEAGDIFIHNSGPAIIYLEDGRSAQARQGILDPATAAVRAKLELG